MLITLGGLLAALFMKRQILQKGTAVREDSCSFSRGNQYRVTDIPEEHAPARLCDLPWVLRDTWS